MIELRGKPVAELLPVTRRRGQPLPDREGFFRKLPRSNDIGKILEEDRL